MTPPRPATLDHDAATAGPTLRAAADAPPPRGLAWKQIRGPLFRKYVGLFLGLVFVLWLGGGGLELFLSYQDHKASLLRLQREQATAAAAKIERFIAEIQDQIGWTVQLPWGAGLIDERRFDAWRLLHQVPAIMELALIDPSGREQLRVSRTAIDVVGSHADRSQDPRFVEATARKISYGPVQFRYGSEPYMTIAMAGIRREDGVAVATVNLKLIWDVVSQLKEGERGRTYVVDAGGHLVAHPDISLVLRRTNLSDLPQVAAALRASTPLKPGAVETRDAEGHGVLTAFAPVNPPGWHVFVEMPVSEAFAPLYASLRRSGLMLLIGLGLVVLSGLFLARRMVVPIQILREGAARIGAGELDRRISIRTGDELEALGEQFNLMAARLQQSYATLEQKVEERTRQLEQANLAKSRFLAAASHDLRQPLHALGLFAAQLRTERNPAERARVEERIEAAIGAMNDLFTELLDISKLDARALSPAVTDFRVARILGRVESAFAGPAGEKGLRLRVVASRAWVRSDPVFLERIALNLVSNAVRYTTRGGIVIGCRRRQSALRLEVWDTGDGIPESQIPDVFGEFVQLEHHKARGPGLGLGLAIVERLCGLLGHPVDVRSRVGRGSCFAVEVPLAQARAESPDAAPHPAAPPDRGRREKLVVIVDDDPLVVDGMGGLLRSWGYGAVAACGAETALSALSARRRPPDLIISDYHLAQGTSGIDVIRNLREAYGADIPAFLVSGDISPDRLQEARDAGYTLLHKPVRPMALRAIVTRFLRSA